MRSLRHIFASRRNEVMEMRIDKTKTGAIVKRSNWRVDQIFAVKVDCHTARNIHVGCQGLF